MFMDLKNSSGQNTVTTTLNLFLIICRPSHPFDLVVSDCSFSGRLSSLSAGKQHVALTTFI